MDFADLPKELSQFKDILHPTRLAILLILSKHLKASASDLRKNLGIPWGTLHSHVQVLVQNGLISVGREFVNGRSLVVLLLEPKGENQLRKFKDVWNRFQ